MGNPANNFAIQDLYSQVISGVANEKTNVSKTVVEVEDLTIDMDLGEFDWSEIQKKSSYFQNKGDQLLVINEVKTSCSCISVDYTRKPVLPGDSLCFTVYYQAENSGYVNKSIVVYCNADISPLKLHVKGFGK